MDETTKMNWISGEAVMSEMHDCVDQVRRLGEDWLVLMKTNHADHPEFDNLMRVIEELITNYNDKMQIYRGAIEKSLDYEEYLRPYLMNFIEENLVGLCTKCLTPYTVDQLPNDMDEDEAFIPVTCRHCANEFEVALPLPIISHYDLLRLMNDNLSREEEEDKKLPGPGMSADTTLAGVTVFRLIWTRVTEMKANYHKTASEIDDTLLEARETVEQLKSSVAKWQEK